LEISSLKNYHAKVKFKAKYVLLKVGVGSFQIGLYLGLV